MRERESMAHPAVVRKPLVGRGLSGYSTQDLYAELITRLGEDPSRDGLLKTPQRTEEAMSFLTKGYREDADKVLHGALFEVDYDEMVIVRDIEVFSLCEHHMLPFFGKVHVAYIPKGKVIGLSKIPRLVEVFARRLQVQERLTRQIADRSPGCGRGDRGPAPVHDDARGREAALLYRNLCHGGSLPPAKHARRVSLVGPVASTKQPVAVARP
jgi:hypothetical protein